MTTLLRLVSGRLAAAGSAAASAAAVDKVLLQSGGHAAHGLPVAVLGGSWNAWRACQVHQQWAGAALLLQYFTSAFKAPAEPATAGGDANSSSHISKRSSLLQLLEEQGSQEGLCWLVWS
jgi:hypothetical protein